MTLAYLVVFWASVTSLALGQTQEIERRSSEKERDRLATSTIDDFDQRKLSESWTAIGQQTKAARVLDSDTPDAAPANYVMSIEMPRGGLIATRADFVLPAPSKQTSLKLRVQAADATPEAPLVIEARFFSGERAAWRWRRIELTDSKWHTVELPLRFFRHHAGTYVDWTEVTRFGLTSRQAGKFQIDDIEFEAVTGRQCRLEADELRTLAFGDGGRTIRRGRFDLITDVEDLNADVVLSALVDLEQAVVKELDLAEASLGRVPLLVFESQETQLRFFEVLGEKLKATISPPKTDGYTVFGIACCVYSDEWGDVRPIYIHEACHALLARPLGLRNQSEWLHEGLASHFQTTLLEQDRVQPARYVVGKPTNWEAIWSGQPISLARYAHAMFFVEWQLNDPARREQFSTRLKSFRERGTTKSQWEDWLLESETQEQWLQAFRDHLNAQIP